MPLPVPFTLEKMIPALEENMRILSNVRDSTFGMLEIAKQQQDDAKFIAHFKRVIERMERLGAVLTIESNRSLTIQVRDAEGEPVGQLLASLRWWWDIFTINPDHWPSYARLVRIWEVARPTPRAGDYRNKNTWSYPGKLIPTQWNGRTEKNMDGEP